MVDEYSARPSEIEYNAFPEGASFREMKVHRKVNNVTGYPVNNQVYRARKYEDEDVWRIRNETAGVNIKYGTLIYRNVVSAIYNWDTSAEM